MTLLERAIAIALKAHAGQKKKNGKPYILHPLRLLFEMETEEAQITAVLHDVLEKSELSLRDLNAEGFPEPIIEALTLLVHHESDSYEDYVRRLKPNALARTVKLADLKDNSQLNHLSGNKEKDFEHLKKYYRAWQILREP